MRCQVLVASSMLVCGTAAVSFADEMSVEVQVEVVVASTDAGVVAPELNAMQAALRPKIAYHSLKQVLQRRLRVGTGAVSIQTPDGSGASLKLLSLSDNQATIQVVVSPTTSTVRLGKTGSVYVQGGVHEGSDIWVVLSRPK